MARADLNSITISVKGEGKEEACHTFTKQFTVGRAVKKNGADLQLDDSFVSIRHSLITPRGANWYLEDLGSTNGTWLNYTKGYVATRLRKGDRIKVGKTLITVLSVTEKLDLKTLAKEARPKARLTLADRVQLEEMYPGAIPLDWHEPSQLDLETPRERRIYMMGYCDGWRDHEIETVANDSGSGEDTRFNRARSEPLERVAREEDPEIRNAS